MRRTWVARNRADPPPPPRSAPARTRPETPATMTQPRARVAPGERHAAFRAGGYLRGVRRRVPCAVDIRSTGRVTGCGRAWLPLVTGLIIWGSGAPKGHRPSLLGGIHALVIPARVARCRAQRGLLLIHRARGARPSGPARAAPR